MYWLQCGWGTEDLFRGCYVLASMELNGHIEEVSCIANTEHGGGY